MGVGGVFAYGGRSDQGNAINNTVILDGATDSATGFHYMSLVGGYSGVTGKDVKTGNTLKVRKKDNRLNSFGNFEFEEFDLGTVDAGDTMLLAKSGAMHSLD